MCEESMKILQALGWSQEDYEETVEMLDKGCILTLDISGSDGVINWGWIA